MAGASAWDRLWTPHRIAYIKGENRPDHQEAGDDCPFCRIPGQDDRSSLIVRRAESVFVVLNLYPYNPGHMLVCPYRHIPDYTQLTDAELTEFSELTQQAMTAMRAAHVRRFFNVRPCLRWMVIVCEAAPCRKVFGDGVSLLHGAPPRRFVSRSRARPTGSG